MQNKKRVFSGARATGRLHLGNYLGMVKGCIELQDREDLDCIFMAVDLHTITTPYDAATLKQATRDIVMDYLAAGLDPEKSIITLQSLVPEHLYLAYLFSSIISVILSKSYAGFQPQSSLAGLSSILPGQLSAIFWRGSGL